MNNPLSYTDPTGYGNFISNGLNAIGNALGGILKAGGKLLRGAAKGVEDLANGVVHAAKVVFRKLAQNQYLATAAQAASCYYGRIRRLCGFCGRSDLCDNGGHWFSGQSRCCRLCDGENL
jgi:hypothetical protein